MMAIHRLSLAIGLLCASCSSTRVADTQPDTITAIEFKRWSWWSTRLGHPYAARVVFHSDLTAEFSGFSFTDREGEYAGTLSADDWQSLLEALEFAGFDSMPVKFPEPEWSDSTYRQITVIRGDRSASVEDYHEAGPPKWQYLVAQVKSITDSISWTRRAP